MLIPRLVALLCFLLPAAPLVAHEFWIEPEAYQVSIGDTIRADFKNGENFKGSRLSYLDRYAARHEMALGGDAEPIPGRAGDRPAVQLPEAQQEGLLVLVHETTPSTITYKEWQKFLKFAAHKDFTKAAEIHQTKGWPTENFKESYTRHVKALIGVGNGKGKDRNFGMETEFVAQTNPYDPGFDNVMRVALFINTQPRRGVQVEVFEKAPDGSVAVTLHRTDDTGIAAIPVLAGHAYLFDAVVLRAAQNSATDPNAPVWETLWAALTFAVPAR